MKSLIGSFGTGNQFHFETVYIPLDKNIRKVVLIQHGDGGTSGSAHNQAVIEAYHEAGYIVIAVDTVDPSRPELAAETQFPEDPDEAEKLRLEVDQKHFEIFEHAADLILEDCNPEKGIIAFAAHSLGANSAIKMVKKLQERGIRIDHVLAYAPARLGDHIESAPEISVPVHIVVGGDDMESKAPTKTFNRRLGQTSELIIIDGANHGFEEKTDELKAAVAGIIARQNAPAPVAEAETPSGP